MAVQAAKLRSECEQLNAQVRDLVNEMSAHEKAELYQNLMTGMKRGGGSIHKITHGLALLGFANIITNIAELKEAEAQ